MVLYECHICNFSSPRRHNYLTHLRSKKHQKQKQECIETDILITKEPVHEMNNDFDCIKDQSNNTFEFSNMLHTTSNVIIDEDDDEYDCMYDEASVANDTLNCTYCGKLFKHKSSRSRHERNHCQYNERIPYSRLVELLNDKNNMLLQIDGENKNYDTKIKEMKSKIKVLVDKIESIEAGYENPKCQNSNQNINAILNINNYHQTNYDFLTKYDFIRCIRDCNKCVQRLVERVHFNPNRPENMNIFVSSYQGKFLMIYRNGKWVMRPKKNEVDILFEEKELILENWLSEYGSQYPDLVRKYNRYVKNKNTAGESFVNELKSEIIMTLYNNRDMVLKHVYDGKPIPMIKAL